jgi:hypothetical protein
MKKFVVLSLISFLILAFGATVYGQEKAPVLEFKASGFMDVITEMNRNVPQPGSGTSASGSTSINDVVYSPPIGYFMPTVDGVADKAFNQEQAYMEGRGRLKFDAIMGKEMMGTFQFEFDSTRWGERAPSGAQRNFAGHWGVADRSAMELKHMYFTFGVPWIPVQTTIQAGIQPIGIRPSIFLSTDGPGITAGFKIDPAYIKLIWAKALENEDWASDDADLYAIEANAKIQTFTLGGYFLLFNMNSYPVGDSASPTNRSDVWWAGFYADGKVGPLLLNFDFAYDKGKVEDRGDFKADDVKFSGWGAALNLGFPWEKFLFGFSSIYGTGADQKKTSATARPGDITPWGTISDKAEAFIVPAGTEGSVGHSLILCGNGINRMNTGFLPAAATAHARAAFGGLWINKLYAAFQVTPIFNTRIEAMYISDTTDNGNTIGNALRADGTPEDKDDIGVEVDWLNTLSIYKNLTFQFGAGILFAGDAMDYAVIGGDPGNNRSPKNPWVLTTNLTYSF